MARIRHRAGTRQSASVPRIALATARARREPLYRIDEARAVERREMILHDDFEIEIDDHQVLDCSNCFRPLRPPVFQCTLGHVYCPSCFKKLSNNCHICTGPVENFRNIALEMVLEASRISCPNKICGCPARIPCYQKNDHKSTCPFVRCGCPDTRSCKFASSSLKLLEHWRSEHEGDVSVFRYGIEFRLTISYMTPFKVLVDNKSDQIQMFVLLVSRVGLGQDRRALSVVRVGPPGQPGPKYSDSVALERDEYGGRVGNSSSTNSRTRRRVIFEAPVTSSTFAKGIDDDIMIQRVLYWLLVNCSRQTWKIVLHMFVSAGYK